MNEIEQLKEYREKLSQLSEEEKKKRDLYLKQLAEGTIQGPNTGFSSIDKQWLKYYDNEDFNYNIPNCSIYNYLKECSKEYDNNIAMEYMGKGIKYKYMYNQIEKTAKALKQYGVKPGDTVSVCLPNIPEVAYVFYAINKIGAVANMLDPRTNESTLQDCIVDSNSKILLSLDSVCPKFESIINNTKLENVVSISALDSFPKPIQILAKFKDKSLNVKKSKNSKFIKWNKFISSGKKYNGTIDAKFDINAPAVIAYTGGTTGKPKGVIATNKNLIAMVVENSKENFNVEIGDKCLNIAPPWTYYGLSNCLNAFLCMGAKTVMVPKLGPNDLGKLINQYKPNHIITVPSALIAVKEDEKLQNSDLNYIKTIIVGADKLDINFEKEFNDFLKSHNSKCLVSKGYGMTEVTAATTYTKINNNVLGTVGIPFIAENVGIFDPETGKELLTGESGEIAINGPKNMSGYFETNEALTESVLKKHDDGTVWAHSNDIGHIDSNGNLYVDGRIKRMFVKNGFKIFSPEIESSIMKHFAVQQCAVVPVSNNINGNIVKAFIVLKPAYRNDNINYENEIVEMLKKNIYDYEIPDLFEFRSELPLTGMNKIDFKVLENEPNVNDNEAMKR